MQLVEERIIDAAIDCLEKYGVRGATVRRISETAGLNGAAVNYYFRSKDALIERAMAITLDNAFSWDDFVHTEPLRLREQLVEIMSHLASGAVKFPTISQAHFYEILANGNYDTSVVPRMTDFMNKLLAQVMTKSAGLDEERARILLMSLVSSVMMYYAVFPRLYDAFSGKDMRDPAAQRAYVETAVDALFAPFAADDGRGG
jgi:AcrR family transcriptional regulator